MDHLQYTNKKDNHTTQKPTLIALLTVYAINLL